MKNKLPKVVVIVGPTASGKSDLGIKLARKFGGEIISADSRQVYKGMDIGTGKVKSEKLKVGKMDFYSSKIKHYLIDIISPKKEFTVSDFKKLGEKAIRKILAKGKTPIIVGGTGFYIDALVKNVSLPEIPPNKKLRKQLDKLTVETLFEKLKKLDPERAKTIDGHNKRRLIRALEIITATGKPVPGLTSKSDYQILWLGLKPKDLEKRIKWRLENRLKKGMIKEIRRLLAQGVSKKRLHDFGLEYRQISEYLASKKTEIPGYAREPSPSKVKSVKNFKKSGYYENLLRTIIQYSKRQMTWFKRNKEIRWVKNLKEAERALTFFLKA